jgi:hypothetical protein
LQRGAGLLHDLELNRTPGLVLDNRRPVSHAAARGDIIDPKTDEIATAQLAVDGEVKQREIALAVLNLRSDANGPDLFRPQGTLLADETAFVHEMREEALLVAISVDMANLHARPRPTAAPAFSGPAIVSQPQRAAGTLSRRTVGVRREAVEGGTRRLPQNRSFALRLKDRPPARLRRLTPLKAPGLGRRTGR